MSHTASHLLELGIDLPTPPAPVASYLPYIVTGNLVYISGQVTMKDGTPQYIGKLGDAISLEDGKAAAKLCAVNVLSVLKVACGGDLDRVTHCVKVNVFVNSTPDFTQQPEVANGASDLFVAVFGHSGRHARAAIGVGSLPRGVAVEVDAVFEIR